MNIRFLGGASEVGSLALKTEVDGQHILFDFGFTPSDPPKFPSMPSKVETALLTHAHIDHSGMMPYIAGRFDAKMIGTPITMTLTELLCHDSLKIAGHEGYGFPYDSSDVNRFKRTYDVKDHGDTIDIGEEGATVSMRSAGHIPGSTMYLLESDRRYMFTGDINTVKTKLVNPTEPVKCDVLFMESTYAGRDHPNRREIERAFLDKVDEVVHRGGLAIVPSFAVGRTQEVLLLLRKSDHEIWLDGMGRTVNKMMLDNPRYLKNADSLRHGVKKAKEVYSSHGRKLAKKGQVIVTTSGMLNGGPVMDYMLHVRKDPKSAILLTGYQVDGTNGRLLMDEGMIDFYGVKEKMQCEVGFFDLSAHAGHSELVDFARGCDPDKLVLCHGDNREELAGALDGEMEVVMMDNMEDGEV